MTAVGKRFTIDGSAELENRAQRICEATRDAILGIVPEVQIEGLVLCGGYGRGEGGVLRVGGEERLYNDLEFFLFLRGNRYSNEAKYGAEIHRRCEALTEEWGIEVEVKLSSLEAFRASGATMFYYDVVMGRRWLIGSEELFEGMDHLRDPGQIPLSEAVRLMMNRCSGLVFATYRLLERKDWSQEDSDFVARNLAKTQLAMGDSLLTAMGRYHWSCRERNRRLESESARIELLRANPQLLEDHRMGVDFKSNPHFDPDRNRADWGAALEEVSQRARGVWLWLESRRLGREFESVQSYLSYDKTKCPGYPIWKNILINAKFFGVKGMSVPGVFRYPRERLFDALCAVLWDANASDPFGSRLDSLLLDGDDPASRLAAYERLWHRFG